MGPIAADLPECAPAMTAARARAVATTARLASGGGIEAELEWLGHHLDGIELALLAAEHADHHPDPRAWVALIQSARDRVTGLTAAAHDAGL
ncbi:hypothetical protein ABLE93_20680 [Xanthobacter sp. KR7-65]|uniref:hypothetical protein n=1 Tax=Xanthobacter sp. KR7-65 TaxID=3156612 RepID=UPI0032B5596E